jgi:hypothetical protein
MATGPLGPVASALGLKETPLSSRGKKKTTMAKLSRESRLRERRQEKAAKKDARRYAAENPPPAGDDTEFAGDDTQLATDDTELASPVTAGESDTA